MKYFYIICLALSSFFTYKHLSADEQSRQYAIFIPADAFQQNNETTAPLRYNHTQNNTTVKKQTNNTANQPKTSEKTANTITTKPKISLPYVKKVVSVTNKTIPDQPKTQQPASTDSANLVNKQTAPAPLASTKPQYELPAPPTMSAEIKEKLNKYSLNDNKETKLRPSPEKNTKNQLSSLERFKQKSINEMLATIPYPDNSQPKFKQIYSLYGIELRVLNRRGSLPLNQEQENTLAKADTIRRFEVK